MKQSRNKRRGAVGEAVRIARARFDYRKRSRSTVVVGEKYKSGVTGSEVVKYCVYAVMGLFLVLLQLTFFTRFRPFDSTPDILIIAVAMIAMYENERAGAIFGVAIGFVAEALGGTGLSLLPLVYMLIGWFGGIAASEYYKRSVLLFLIFDVGACTVRMFVTLIYVVCIWETADMSVIFPNVLVPEMLSTFVMAPVPALLLYPVWRIFRGETENKPGLD